MQVGIHADDNVAHGMIDAGNHGGFMAEITREVDGFGTAVGRDYTVEEYGASIGTPVVDIQHLCVVVWEGQRFGQFTVELP